MSNISMRRWIWNHCFCSCSMPQICNSHLGSPKINRQTQLSLYSKCVGLCLGPLSIRWDIYREVFDSNSNTTRLVIVDLNSSTTNSPFYFGQLNIVDRWEIDHDIRSFLGRTTSNLTVTNQLLQTYSNVTKWHFHAFYLFNTEQAKGTITLNVNQPPRNGSCSMDPKNGTISTLFSVSCRNWYDDDDIKDYSIYGRILMTKVHRKINVSLFSLENR